MIRLNTMDVIFLSMFVVILVLYVDVLYIPNLEQFVKYNSQVNYHNHINQTINHKVKSLTIKTSTCQILVDNDEYIVKTNVSNFIREPKRILLRNVKVGDVYNILTNKRNITIIVNDYKPKLEVVKYGDVIHIHFENNGCLVKNLNITGTIIKVKPFTTIDFDLKPHTLLTVNGITYYTPSPKNITNKHNNINNFISMNYTFITRNYTFVPVRVTEPYYFIVSNVSNNRIFIQTNYVGNITIEGDYVVNYTIKNNTIVLPFDILPKNKKIIIKYGNVEKTIYVINPNVWDHHFKVVNYPEVVYKPFIPVNIQVLKPTRVYVNVVTSYYTETYVFNLTNSTKVLIIPYKIYNPNTKVDYVHITIYTGDMLYIYKFNTLVYVPKDYIKTDIKDDKLIIIPEFPLYDVNISVYLVRNNKLVIIRDFEHKLDYKEFELSGGFVHKVVISTKYGDILFRVFH